MSQRRLLTFPAKVQLDRDVALSVAELLTLIPLLGEQNPDAALHVRDLVKGWLPPTPEDGEEQRIPDALPHRRFKMAKWVSREMTVVNMLSMLRTARQRP